MFNGGRLTRVPVYNYTRLFDIDETKSIKLQ